MNQQTKEKKTRGRPRKFNSPDEKREYLKLRAKKYYSSPEVREKQILKMREYNSKNRELINSKRRKRYALMKLRELSTSPIPVTV